MPIWYRLQVQKLLLPLSTPKKRERSRRERGKWQREREREREREHRRARKRTEEQQGRRKLGATPNGKKPGSGQNFFAVHWVWMVSEGPPQDDLQNSHPVYR